MGATAVNSNQQAFFKMGLLEKEISFQEESLLGYKSIQHSLKDYITASFIASRPEVGHKVLGQDWQIDFADDGQYALGRRLGFIRKVPGYLDRFLEVSINYEAGFVETAQNQIAGFEEFLKRRQEGAYHGIAEKERRVIRKVELAIAAYRSYNCVGLYNKFKKALADYFCWLERKIKKSTSYLKYLNRIMSGFGVVVDHRRLLRTIMRFLCRRLDDEHRVNHKISDILSNYFFGLTSVNHEYRTYKSNN